MNQHPAIQKLEAKHMRTDVPDFRPGDQVSVRIKVREGERERTQIFVGVVIGKRNRGLSSSFKVRRFAHGVGVERTFQTHSPLIEGIEIQRRGAVRKAKLYYLRELVGRKARIREKIGAKLGDTGSIAAQEDMEAEKTAAAAEIADDVVEGAADDAADNTANDAAENKS